MRRKDSVKAILPLSSGRLIGASLTIFLLCLGASAHAGATVTTIHSFSAPAPNGENPYTALVQGSDGNFYGTADTGGAYGAGAIFQITPEGSVTNLYSFTGGNDGASPRGALVRGANGNFYGTAEAGGADNDGTVFEITSAGVFTLLHSFAGYPQDGASPYAALVQGNDGNFYGTTSGGGDSRYGTVFQITPAGVCANLYSFRGQTDGAAPFAPLVQGVDGALYGTTYSGGNTSLNGGYGFGAIFSITTNGIVSPLYAFADGSDGETPYSALVQGVDGNFYGTAIHGTTGDGVIFQITPGGGFTVLHEFAGTDGDAPLGALVQGADTNFYGTTLGGGSNNEGTVFQFTTNGVLTSLYSFTNGSDGAEPFAGLIQGTDGNLYGTTKGVDALQPDTFGSIFQITTQGALTPLYKFPGGSDGATPHAGLIVGTNGNLYGTTEYGGANGEGTAFETTLDGTFTLLYSFTGLGDGATPYGALVRGSDGNFYGTDGDDYGSIILAQSGAAAFGTVFKMTPAGAVTVLHAFTDGSDGGSPRAGLVQGLDGNFYGTSEIGGANGQGTIFRITPAGVLTNLHSFTGGSDGGLPWAALVQAGDTNFYGTAWSGGTGFGTLFRISPAGVFTLIKDFSSGKTASPYAPLALGTNGSLYGCTSGENGGYGTIFMLTPPNAFSLLYTFTNGNDGEDPSGGVVQGSDGNFYGTSSSGGPNDSGVVFRVTPAGLFQSLYAFSTVNANGFNQDGAFPSSALVQAGDGNFYGTTEYGGPYGSGTIFRLTIKPPSPPVFLSAIETAGALSFTWSAEYGSLYQLQYSTNLSQTNWTNLGGPKAANGATLGASDTDPPDAQRFYRVVLLP